MMRAVTPSSDQTSIFLPCMYVVGFAPGTIRIHRRHVNTTNNNYMGRLLNYTFQFYIIIIFVW